MDSEQSWIWLRAQSGPGFEYRPRGHRFGYWLLDIDGSKLGCRVRMNMKLTKDLVVIFRIRYRLRAVVGLDKDMTMTLG